MTIMRCTKCGNDHEVDVSKTGWSTMCEVCRPKWDMEQRAWMAKKLKRKPLYRRKEQT